MAQNTGVSMPARKRDKPFTPTWAVPPSEIIREELIERGWTDDDFARTIKWTRETLDALLVQNEPLTEQQAVDIARGFGTSIQFWVNLELMYRRWLGKQRFEGTPGWALVQKHDVKERRSAAQRGEGRE